MKFKDRLRRFFYGRYGIDGLYYALFTLFLLIWVVRIFVRSPIASGVLYLIELCVLVFMIYRSFSRNIYKRRRENEKFMSFFKKIKNFFVLQKDRIRDFKKLRYRKCPHCKATLRLPPKKGSHTVNCPCCRKSFKVKVII